MMLPVERAVTTDDDEKSPPRRKKTIVVIILPTMAPKEQVGLRVCLLSPW
jgi:hypothetical protein